MALPAHDPFHVVCCYLPCQSSNTWNEFGRMGRVDALALWYESLQSAVEQPGRDTVVVCGDFNSRTGLLPEAGDDDWATLALLGLPVPDSIAAYTSALQCIRRRSNKDAQPNTWGRSLLDFARESQLVLANGRLPGDTAGEFTFDSPTGRSSIDYFLVPPSLCFCSDGSPLEHSSLTVLPFDSLPNKPSLTAETSRFDHAPVILSFAVPRTPPRQGHRGERCRAYKWDASRQELYANTISTDVQVQMLLGRVLGAPAGSGRRAAQTQGPECVAQVDSLTEIPMDTVLAAFDDKYSTHMWGDWRTLAQDTPPLRDTPEANSTGFKSATYRHYFCTDTIEQGSGFVDHLHTPAQVKALSSFRLSSHDLNIERLRHRRVPRHQRLCTCCTLNVVEDELHVLECPAYAGLRVTYADLLPNPIPENAETLMRAFMNPSEPAQWRRLADFLSLVMHERTRILTDQNENINQ